MKVLEAFDDATNGGYAAHVRIEGADWLLSLGRYCSGSPLTVTAMYPLNVYGISGKSLLTDPQFVAAGLPPLHETVAAVEAAVEAAGDELGEVLDFLRICEDFRQIDALRNAVARRYG